MIFVSTRGCKKKKCCCKINYAIFVSFPVVFACVCVWCVNMHAHTSLVEFLNYLACCFSVYGDIWPRSWCVLFLIPRREPITYKQENRGWLVRPLTLFRFWLLALAFLEGSCFGVPSLWCMQSLLELVVPGVLGRQLLYCFCGTLGWLFVRAPPLSPIWGTHPTFSSCLIYFLLLVLCTILDSFSVGPTHLHLFPENF